jgi:uncharacterized Zn finger protein
MQKLSEDALLELFDDRTYERGLEYYENGHVLKPARFNDTIYAKVIGNAPEPYEIVAFINGKDTFTRCTCPVGGMCKHGVALLLTWINEPGKFSDRGKIIQALEKKSKEELLEIIKKAIDGHPYLVDELNIRAEGIKGLAEADAGALIKKIKRILSDENSYYSASVVKRLEDIRDAANMLVKGERYADACRVYLKLVEAGIEVFGDFIEDDEVSYEASGLVEHSIKDFNECAPYVDEAEKERLWDEIFEVIGLDEWGLDIDELFYGVVTKENVGWLEARLMGGDKEPVEKGVVDYSRKGAMDLLNLIYDRLGMPEEKIRLARSRLDDKEDYALLSNVLRDEGKFEEALDVATRGLLQEESTSLALDESYIKAAYLAAKKDSKTVDFNLTMNVAMEILSRRFDTSSYDLISDVFRLMGRYEDFTSAIPLSHNNRESIIKALLHSGEIEKAVAIASAGIADNGLTVKVAEAAAKKGMMKESALLAASLVLKLRPFELYSYPFTDRLLGVMASHLELPELNKVCEHVIKTNLRDLAVRLMPRIANRDPELAMPLIRRFSRETPAGTTGMVALAIGKEQPEEGLKLCRSKITNDLLVSHHHYEDIILLLKVMKAIYESAGRASDWTMFIRSFVSDHKGKKKLVSMLEAAYGADI